MSTAHSIVPLLELDAAHEVERLTARIRESITGQLRRRGAVVGVSGGIDSSVVAYLCARALGPERVALLAMPESESSPDSLRLARLVGTSLGSPVLVEDIAPVLTASGAYQRRDEAIRMVIPEYGPGWTSKIVLPPATDVQHYSVFTLVAREPGGALHRKRLPLNAYLGVVAATNFKQRVRKMLEYYYADLYHYAVAGTPNRLEYELGFFVKNGDGSADLKPLAHLYKSQVYQLADYLGVPEEIQRRPPTTDTYSLEQSQEEFYFSLPLDKLDLCLYGRVHGIPATDLAAMTDLTPEQISQVYADIDSKRSAAQYLHLVPLLTEPSDSA